MQRSVQTIKSTNMISGDNQDAQRGIICPVAEISRLHHEISNHLESAVAKGRRIGELLIAQKATLKHGQFGVWLKENCPFSSRTAQRYISLQRNVPKAKCDTVSHLTGSGPAQSEVLDLSILTEQLESHSKQLAELSVAAHAASDEDDLIQIARRAVTIEREIRESRLSSGRTQGERFI
ncbi:DUF3102 domain-containing protein [Planctomicrobium sp. SH661]|uniref:DUF3102 domain-containing protein n=1 Tax=Planctomicrobium sp. SH661 TaxID=3448124 RepID=UPI003F5B32E5